MSFVSEWRDWHAARERLAGSEYGPSALESTNWLIEMPAAVDGIPGLWALTGDGGIRGSDLGQAGRTVTLRGAETVRLGRRELRVFDRHGTLALRVLNPARPQREWFTAIDAYAPDERWRLPARFEPTPDERIVITSVDGEERESPVAGRLHFELAGTPQTLTVTRSAQGALSAVFADGTNGLETYRFRFLPIEEPAEDGSAVVDFNRAYLPPCAFSDQFVCPLPPLGNRYSTPIRAGERVVVLGG
ncbi:DUF1684 domain-containing protein [Microbacterium sp. W4I20]|jgi:uncharacterized protein (DUF1684 family)|uniref:DUF1684 domain-containing protein n=1 Tax=Microbacterium sp. W4I20 TaxID=3042262 RepID=UPI0027822CE1|nr:DUF1684 domain-containing protein [Microbacterium sp. W4I20]MDQ0728221.1 uncharacterized protein (DUF1684 family) [Microbacterium sp. W4I20]